MAKFYQYLLLIMYQALFIVSSGFQLQANYYKILDCILKFKLHY